MNGITALFSGFAAGFLALSGNKLGYRAPILGAMIFAFTPVIYINSVNSMDYIWAIAFILGSLYFALSDRATLAGLLLGLAIGTRITSIVILLPLILVLTYRDAERKDMVRLPLIAVALGSLFYLPALSVYGAGFLKHHVGARIPLVGILANATTGVWGWFGLGVILISISMVLWQLIRSGPVMSQLNRSGYWKIWGVAITAYLLVYLYLPHEAAYLIPMVPFSILFLQEFMTKKMLFLFSMAVICSSLLIGIFSKSLIHAPGFDQRYRNLATRLRFSKVDFVLVPFYGSLLYDHTYRKDEIERIEDVIDFGNELQDASVIIVGWNLPKYAKLGLSLNKNSQNTIYTDFLDSVTLRNYLDNGLQIYYLPEMLPTSIDLYKIDLRDFGGEEIDIE